MFNFIIISIDKIFPEIKKELGYKDAESNFEWLANLFRQFGELGFLLKFLFLVIIIAIAIFTVYKIVLTFSKSNKSIERSKEISVESENLTFNELLKKIEKLKEEGDFNNAILYMHYSTIAYLVENNTLREDRDYTNREILSKISNKTYLETFRKIAVKAQGILFNDETINKENFNILEENFKRDFI